MDAPLTRLSFPIEQVMVRGSACYDSRVIDAIEDVRTNRDVLFT